ncbi:cytochrome P450 [Xylaria cf. heliscus]|nr:cytochrome P450 [Xylaria cf. heliscus]
MPSLIILAVITGVFTLLVRYYSFDSAPSKESLKHIPELRFETDDTDVRYVTDSRALLRRGYDKYLRNGIAFQMRNPVPELGPHVFLPLKYLNEVKAAPRSLSNFEVFSEKLFLLDYSDAPQQTDAAVHVTRVDLTKNLGKNFSFPRNLVPGIYAETVATIESRLNSKTWVTVPAYETISSISTQANAYALVGPSLCRNPEWLRISLQAAMAVFGAAREIRDNYSGRWRWLSRYGDVPKQMRAMRAQAAKLLQPLYKDRLEALESKKSDGQGFLDGTNWLLQSKSSKSLEKITDQQVFLSVVSTHTTSSVLVSVLFDLLQRPECYEEILAEIREVMGEHNGQWTAQNVAKMIKLDSFMRQSTRFNPLGYMAVQRVAMKKHIFKDGFHLPKGTVYQFHADGVHSDPSFYPDPDKFDMHRFARLREEVDKNKFHFASVSDSSLTFGAGNHACPGRFFAALVIKMTLVVLLTRYEVKLEDTSEKGEKVPLRVPDHFTMNPNPTMKIAVRKL